MSDLDTSGVGLRAPHHKEFLNQRQSVGFLEAHSENFFGGGAAPKLLKKLRENYQISLHGVGLSLGRADGLDLDHLTQLKSLIDRINPVFVSEHLSWSAYSHIHVPDLLPIPFTHEALGIFCDHVEQFQELIGRQILVENPSNYLAFATIEMSEPEFLIELARRTGCGLLMDINNIAVSAHNLGYDPYDYLNAFAPGFAAIKQIHLAGYQVNKIADGQTLYIDTHGQPVYDEVWALYDHALHRFGDIPTLIEWDTDIPPLPTLLAEAARADRVRADRRLTYAA